MAASLRVATFYDLPGNLYDRVLGQLRRYMGWINKNHAEPEQMVRGIIVAREISEDLVLACFGVPNVELFEYEMSVTVKKVAV